MKGNIPILQLKDNISGIYIDKLDNSFVLSIFDQISRLHRKDYFICILLTAGNIKLLVDFKQVKIQKNQLLFLLPGQIQQALDFENTNSGWVLFLDNKMVDEHSRLIIEDSLLNEPILPLSEPDLQWYIQYFDLLFKTYHDHNFGGFHKSAVYSLTMPCIYKIASAFQASSDSLLNQYSQRKIELTKKFKRLVWKHYHELKKPSDYARIMNYSATYLNDTIKTVTGFNATYFIQQEMLRESQRLLCYSDLSIKEIAAELGYDDSKYFNRIFTKLCGISPGKFRKDFTAPKKS